MSAGVLWSQDRDDAAKPAQKSADEEGEATTVTHDTNGNAVINMSDEIQGDAGIVVTNVAAGLWSPEVKGYGRVLDPAPLASLVNELSAAQAAADASGREYERLKTLSAQNNASARALQAAQAAAARDQLAVQSARDRLALSWGNVLAGQNDLTVFIQSLITRERVLLRIDLPAGQALEGPPSEARILALSGKMTNGKFLGPAPATDAQFQGQGFMFAVEPNTLALVYGQAVSGYLKVPGQPLNGVIIPSEAIVRTEGAGWVYVMNAGGESFTRKAIPLDRPTDSGWFVSSGITPRDYIVQIGAQTLLSQELKGALKPD